MSRGAADAPAQVTAIRQPKLALLAATLALLIGGPALAQDAAPTIPDQSREHYVPQHFDRNGVYVPPHYEIPKPLPFRGYFADKEAARAKAKQHGYTEPAPDYTTKPPADDQQGEGR